MRHLKIYEKFEYSQKLKDQVAHFGWNNDYIRYVVAPPRSRNPELGEYVGTDFLSAVKELKRLNSEYDDTFVLFESKIRVLSQEEIDLALNTKKYNL